MKTTHSNSRPQNDGRPVRDARANIVPTAGQNTKAHMGIKVYCESLGYCTGMHVSHYLSEFREFAAQILPGETGVISPSPIHPLLLTLFFHPCTFTPPCYILRLVMAALI